MIMWIMIVLSVFCLVASPAMADYGCAVNAKSCTSDVGKSSPDKKAIACPHCADSPAVFVNGQQVEGENAEAVRQAVDAALKGKK